MKNKIDAEKWWDSLGTHKCYELLRKYFHDTIATPSLEMIVLMYYAEHRNNISNCLDYASELNKHELSKRYDFIATSLLTLPLTIDELADIIKVLKASKDKNI